VERGDLLERQVGQEHLAARAQPGRQPDADPAAHPQRLGRLDRVDELDVGPHPDHQVARLPDPLGQPGEMRPGDAKQRGGGTEAAAAQIRQRAADPVRAVTRLLDEPAEPEHGDQPVRGRFRDAELGRRLAHPEQAVPLQHQQQQQHMVNRLHWIGRRSLVPHHRTISK
jgi:hypothetical protein